jgi:hypothetical protein
VWITSAVSISTAPPQHQLDQDPRHIQQTRERHQTACSKHSLNDINKINSSRLEIKVNVMEDIQFSGAGAETFTSAMDEVGDEFLPAETMETVLEDPYKVEVDSAPVLQALKVTVEVVINEKLVLEPEDPIVPDHYYDDGNVPVFKPVCSIPFCTYTNDLDNGPISRL